MLGGEIEQRDLLAIARGHVQRLSGKYFDDRIVERNAAVEHHARQNCRGEGLASPNRFQRAVCASSGRAVARRTGLIDRNRPVIDNSLR